MRFTMYKSGTEWRWRLKASNHKIIAISSESYTNKSDCKDAIALVKGASNAPIDEE